MKFFKLTLAIMALILASCTHDSNNICNVDNPITDLEWLKKRIDTMKKNSDLVIYCYVVQGEYKRKTVFMFYDCNPSINKGILLLNCNGDTINSIENYISPEKVKHKKIIWKPDNFMCEPSF